MEETRFVVIRESGVNEFAKALEQCHEEAKKRKLGLVVLAINTGQNEFTAVVDFGIPLDEVI